MIKSFIANTREIDDADAAVAEILAALEPEKNLLGNSIGIISCFSEFCETGVLQAVCDALPFDCIGTTTCLCAADREIDQIILSIMVLTSDDCSFKTISVEVEGDYESELGAKLGGFIKQTDEQPALILSYFPLINEISGDMILAAVDKVTGGIPLFGTAAIDHTMDYSSSHTIYNGQGYRRAVVMAAIYGSPTFTFETASLDDSKTRNQKAIITESAGNILIGVNGKTALEYLNELGLTREELATGTGVIPLVLDHKDGTKPIARAVFALTDEGHAVCGGEMPVNMTLGIGSINKEDVLQTTNKTLESIMDEESAVLGYSCLARYLVLGAQNTAEAEALMEVAGDSKYLFTYSGGEICPLPDANGKLHNFYHNYTAAFCRLS